jgi:hypothetical protein
MLDILSNIKNIKTKATAMTAALLMLSSCAQVNVPGARDLDIPSPVKAEKRPESVNEKPDSVLYLPLGSDVLVPKAMGSGGLPSDIVGPFELRSETLAGALQLILADYEVPLAFETEEGLTRTITVTNLRGPIDRVVNRICGLADLYCAFDDGVLTVKETQTFTVTIPPIGGDTDIMGSLATGIQAITGSSPIVESGTRTLIYEATSRTSKLAERYFQRLRANTALIVFQVYIWEVTLDTGNATGISWEGISKIGEYASGIDIPGGATGLDSTPISIGLPTKNQVDLTSGDVLDFISEYGAVKTISQPQITVLSGADATLRAADTTNYVSSLSRSVDDGEVTVSSETDSVDTGFTLTISSNWDNATIYSDIDIQLQEFRGFQTFDFDENTTIRLPETTEREVNTQVRIRPGDSLLIAGLVRESDQFDKSGPGFSEPIIPTSRSTIINNRELVFLLKPRVIVYTDDADRRRLEAENKVVNPIDSAVDLKDLNPSGDVPSTEQGPVLFPVNTVPLDLLDPAQ